MVKRTGDGLANYLKKLVPESNGAYVKVGVLENSKYPDGTPVPLVAFWNEYGTRTAPSRPFFRDTIEQNKKNWSDMTKRGIAKGLPITEILGLVGLQMENDIKTAIMTWQDPPNSPNTIRKPNNKSPSNMKKKPNNSPLRHTMLMYDSIKSEVVEE